MTAPPPGGHPSWGPGPSPLPRPLAFGMLPQGPYLGEGVAIMCGFAIFNPVLASSAISVEVDGYELAPVKWGRIEVPVVPGTHRFRVFIRRGAERKHLAECTGEVRAGELLELTYMFPRFGGVQLYSTPTAAESRRALLVYFALVAVIWALLWGVTLL